MQEPLRILLAESDPRAGRLLAEQLSADGYSVALALTAQHARTLARAHEPELALLGALDPPRGPLALLEEIRGEQPPPRAFEPSLPVIVFGPRHELQVLRAFDAGADDYVAHATHYLELRARVRALLRRSARATLAQRRLLEVGALTVDTTTYRASLRGRPLALSRMEFELLAHLARDPKRAFRRDELLRDLWGLPGSSSRTVDSHASRLRRKLDPGGTVSWLVSVRGVGYRLT